MVVLDTGLSCSPPLGSLQVPLGQDVFQRVQLLCQLSDPALQPLVLLLQLPGPLLGQQDPPAGLVPALPHSHVVPLSPQPVLCTVLAEAPLVDRGPQSGHEEGGEVLLRVDMALVVVCVSCIGGVAETGRRVGQIRQSHHLVRDPVIRAPPPQPLSLAVRHHVHLRQLIGRRGLVEGVVLPRV